MATLSKALTEAVSLPLVVGRGTTEPGDHRSPKTFAIAIAAGQTTGTTEIATAPDDDGDTVLGIARRAVGAVSRGDRQPRSVRVTIAADDAKPLVVSVADHTETGRPRMGFMATLSHAASHRVVVNYRTKKGRRRRGRTRRTRGWCRRRRTRISRCGRAPVRNLTA